MIAWKFYPKSAEPTALAREVVRAFEDVESKISSSRHKLTSNAVLSCVAPGLVAAGFTVEASRKATDKIRVPVLFGRQGKPEKSFDADALHNDSGFVVEVEAGRALTNYQFLKDVFEACMMHDVDYLAVAVRQTYRGNMDFEAICVFFDTLFASARLSLPLKGILVVGY